MKFSVQIDGDYGDEDTQIALLADGEEMVMWASDEWREDPSLVIVIADAIRLGYEDGPEAIKARLEASS